MFTIEKKDNEQAIIFEYNNGISLSFWVNFGALEDANVDASDWESLVNELYFEIKPFSAYCLSGDNEISFKNKGNVIEFSIFAEFGTGISINIPLDLCREPFIELSQSYHGKKYYPSDDSETISDLSN